MTNALILLVSDNPLTRKMVRSTLSAKGYALIEAESPRAALAQLDSASPALVLQDLVLPDTEQFRLTASLRARLGDEVPILAFVGLRSELDDARLAIAGFNDTIIKPIDATRLLQTVDGHLPARLSQTDRFGAGRRLILADDDPLQLKLMRFRLERYGFTVATANDGTSALLLAEQSPPDAIVADIMMPEMDGFGLALAVRQAASLQHLPLILITASYIEESDRELARRAGATELVLHTPDLVALIDTLRRALAQPMAAPRIGPERRVEVEHEHERRIVRQLERQVLLNAGLSRRCSALAAELRVLAGLSENVLKHRDLDPALDEALIACLDACGIARGVLYLLSGDDRIKVRAVGAETTWTHEQLRDFFGHERTLRELIAAGGSAFLSIDADLTREQQQLLAACAVSSMLIVPLIYLDRPFGALMLAEPSQSQNADDLIAFAEGLAAQITQVLALAAAFAEESRARDRAEQQAALCSALLLHAPDCVAHLDTHGAILFVNHVMRESLPEMQVGREWLSAQPLEFRERAGQAFELVIST
ncbi:MAG TPA: response regulator, partial [Polyangiales bacterium]|nr:response regulator [Polyangiales bacterium]